MNNLSYTQEFYLCAINSKGKIPVLKEAEIQVCLLAGSILELIEFDFLKYNEKKELIVIKDRDNSLPYLKTLYDSIVAFKKPKDLKGLVDYYLFSLSGREFKKLLNAIGVSLLDSDLVIELTNQGITKNKTRYAPRETAVTKVIEKVRAEFLEEGMISDETVYLTSLLDKSSLIGDYFSKVESKSLKVRLKEIRQSEAYSSIKEMLDYFEEIIAVMIVISSTISSISS